MDPKPLISILVPCYNHEDYVVQTIESLISQSYENLELLVIDDGSRDASFQRLLDLEPVCRKRFVRLHLEQKRNEGVARTLNRALSLARGEFVFHLASDDFIEPDLVARLVAAAVQDSRIGLACADADFVDKQGKRIYLSPEGREVDSCAPGAAPTFMQHYAGRRTDFDYRRDFGQYWTFLRGNYIPIGLLVRRQAQIEMGGYDTSYRAEDYDSWLKLSKRWRFHLIDEVLAHYRWHGSNSVIRLRNLVLRDSIRLFLRERSYCEAHELSALWREIFRQNLSLHVAALLDQRDWDTLLLILRASRLPELRPFVGTIRHWIMARLGRPAAGKTP